jgi:hypothetical protein
MKSLSLLATALAVGSVAAIPASHPLLAKLDKRQGGMTAMVNGMFNRMLKTAKCISGIQIFANSYLSQGRQSC